MKAVIQRVSRASVSVNGQIVGKVGEGLVVLLGIQQNDEEADAEYLAKKIPDLRIFQDNADKMNCSLKEVGGSILAVSQFTLYANTRKGRRPSFIHAALPEKAEPLYEFFISKIRQEGIDVQTGVFGEMMTVDIRNQGPVTIIIDSIDRFKPRK